MTMLAGLAGGALGPGGGGLSSSSSATSTLNDSGSQQVGGGTNIIGNAGGFDFKGLGQFLQELNSGSPVNGSLGFPLSSPFGPSAQPAPLVAPSIAAGQGTPTWVWLAAAGVAGIALLLVLRKRH